TLCIAELKEINDTSFESMLDECMTSDIESSTASNISSGSCSAIETFGGNNSYPSFACFIISPVSRYRTAFVYVVQICTPIIYLFLSNIKYLFLQHVRAHL